MIKLLHLIFLFMILACNDYNQLPKPNAYLSLDYPLTNYSTEKFYPKDITLQYNSSASNIESINNSNNLISKRINYKKHNANILIDLHEINNNTDLSRILNELNDFTNIHLKKKNSVINVQEYINESQIIYASIIKIKGEVTSPYQFYITDSLKNVITASVRYNESIKYDSVLPSLKYIEKDIYHLIETLKWNPIND